MYCRGAAAVILTYDVNHAQSLLELEDRFLGLTDTASADCLFAVVGNKVDLIEEAPGEGGQGGGRDPGQAGGGGGGSPAPRPSRQVQLEDAVAFYKKILKYKMLDEKDVPAAEQMCFETSAKTGKNVDLLFETVFDMVVPVILRQRAQALPQTVDIASAPLPAQTSVGLHAEEEPGGIASRSPRQGPCDQPPASIAALGGGEQTDRPEEPPAEPGSLRLTSPRCPVLTPGL